MRSSRPAERGRPSGSATAPSRRAHHCRHTLAAAPSAGQSAGQPALHGCSGRGCLPNRGDNCACSGAPERPSAWVERAGQPRRISGRALAAQAAPRHAAGLVSPRRSGADRSRYSARPGVSRPADLRVCATGGATAAGQAGLGRGVGLPGAMHSVYGGSARTAALLLRIRRRELAHDGHSHRSVVLLHQRSVFQKP